MLICKQQEGAAPGYDAPIPKRKRHDTRDVVMALWEVAQLTKDLSPLKKVRSMEILISYGLKHHSRRRRTPMNVNKMIEDWQAAIVTLCTAHDRKQIDAAEYQMDELLSPLLAAPVKDLRAFYDGLASALEADPRVPYFIWSLFAAWGEVVVKPSIEKTKIKRLRRKLATEIAEMVDEDIKPDITKALVGALMWRDKESLTAIKGDLEAGAKPKLRGRESCLFLVTEGQDGTEHKVML